MNNSLKSADEVENLICEYKKTNDKKRKQVIHMKIIQRSMPVAKNIIGVINTKSLGIPYEDLLQVAIIGLIKSIETYDIGKNTKFNTFAAYYIRGEVRHYIRDNASMLKAPREYRELFYKAARAIKQLNNEGIENPTNEQIALKLDISQEVLEDFIKMEFVKTSVSLDQSFPYDDGENSLIENIPSEDHLTEREDRIMLDEAISKLPQDLKQIIQLFFFQGYTQKEIAEITKISQMQVSRKIKLAIRRLYTIITKQREESVTHKEA